MRPLLKSCATESANAHQPIMLLVLGSHRCGTSLTARMLECLGAKNSPNLAPANEYNSKGYFEDWDVYHFNEQKLLPKLGATWQSIGPIDWQQLEGDADLHSEACKIISNNYKLDQRLSVLKEPRIARLLPFWLPVIREAGFEVRTVIALRDPLSSSLSLSQRDGLSITHSAMIYLANWRSILADASTLPMTIVHYENILTSSEKTLQDIVSALSLELPEDFYVRLEDFVETHLDAGLCHNRHSLDQVLTDTRLPKLVSSFYKALCNSAALQNIPNMNASAQLLEANLIPVDNILVDYDRLKATLEKTTEDLKVSLQQAESYSKEVEKRVSTLQAALEQQSEQHLTKEQELIRRISALEKLIQDITNSISWRITAPIRYLKSFAKFCCRALLP